jgi:hypothetical protein
MGRRKPTRYYTVFIELVICSTSFGHVYAHHQELATVLLVWHVARNFWLLVVGRSGAEQQAMHPGWGMLFEQHPSLRTHSLLPCTLPSVHQQPGITRRMPYQQYSPELLMMGINMPETCWADYKFNKHCVPSSWFSSSHITTMHGQTDVKFIDYNFAFDAVCFYDTNCQVVLK